MSTAHEKSPTAATAARSPAEANPDDSNGHPAKNTRGTPGGEDAGGAGGARPPSSERKQGDARAASAADDKHAARKEGRPKTEEDIQNERHSDPPVWSETIDDLGDYTSDDAADVSVGSDGASPPELKRSNADHAVGVGFDDVNAAAASVDEEMHMDKVVFEDRMSPVDLEQAEDEVAAECNQDPAADASLGGLAPNLNPHETTASTRSGPAQCNAARLAGLRGKRPRPGAPAFPDSQAGSGAGDPRDPQHIARSGTGTGK